MFEKDFQITFSYSFILYLTQQAQQSEQLPNKMTSFLFLFKDTYTEKRDKEKRSILAHMIDFGAHVHP